MKIYFENKLKEIAQAIQRERDSIIKHANNLEIKELTYRTHDLSKINDRFKELTIDAVIYLTVDEIIDLYKTGLLQEYDAASTFQYKRKVTIEERDKLTKVCYRFKDAKV